VPNLGVNRDNPLTYSDDISDIFITWVRRQIISETGLTRPLWVQFRMRKFHQNQDPVSLSLMTLYLVPQYPSAETLRLRLSIFIEQEERIPTPTDTGISLPN